MVPSAWRPTPARNAVTAKGAVTLIEAVGEPSQGTKPSRLQNKMKKKKVRDKFPVYKRAIPFAVPIFFGAILTIVVGNLLFIAILG